MTKQFVQNAFESALAHMVREDPSLVVEVDKESGQTVLKGIGELHLEVRAHGKLHGHHSVINDTRALNIFIEIVLLL